jgi:hypothetical protein
MSKKCGDISDIIEKASKETSKSTISDFFKMLDKAPFPGFLKKIKDINDSIENKGKNPNDFNNEVKYVEGFEENIPVLNIIQEQVNKRHNHFKNSPAFPVQCRQNSEQTFEEFKSNELNDFDKLKQYMESYIKSYDGLYQYKITMGGLKNEKLNQLNNLNKKIDTYKQNLFIDNRKNTYQYKNLEFYKSAHFYMLILYFSLFILYLIFSDFIKEEKYKDKKIAGLIILFIVFPFILQYILYYIYYAYIYIIEYNNLKDDPISYPYIIDE